MGDAMGDYWEGPTYMGGLPKKGPFSDANVPTRPSWAPAVQYKWVRNVGMGGYEVTAIALATPCGCKVGAATFVTYEVFAGNEPSARSLTERTLNYRLATELRHHRCNEREEPTMDMRETYERMAREAAEKLAALDRVPNLAEMPPGTVLFYSVTYQTGGVYDYVAILVDVPGNERLWYSSGTRTAPKTDQSMTEFLATQDVREISIVREWEVLYGGPAETETEES